MHWFGSTEHHSSFLSLFFFPRLFNFSQLWNMKILRTADKRFPQISFSSLVTKKEIKTISAGFKWSMTTVKYIWELHTFQVFLPVILYSLKFKMWTLGEPLSVTLCSGPLGVTRFSPPERAAELKSLSQFEYRLKLSCRWGRGCVQGAWEKPALLETCFPLRPIRLLIDSRLKVGCMLPLAQESSSGYQMYRRVQKSETTRQEKFFFCPTFERRVTRDQICTVWSKIKVWLESRLAPTKSFFVIL